MNFESLSQTISQTHTALQQNAVKAINLHLTLRNWLIGCYIVEFEQQGEDRAAYGEKLLKKLSEHLRIKGLSDPELSRCRQFYQSYPYLLKPVSQVLTTLLPTQGGADILDKVLSLSRMPILGMASQELQAPEEENHLKKLFFQVSYSHFVELIKIQDPPKRRFYELITLTTHPSVQELKRQMQALTYERLGLSGNYETAFEQIQQKIIPAQPTDAVRSHYFFEFLGLSAPHLLEEAELESQIIQHLQEFMLEMGNGFCFEARQKRILIDEEYYFIDLVFYHRLLKCHVLLELKTNAFQPAYAAQLNTYVAYYNDQVRQPGDNPAIGILLCTQKGKKLVEYALAGLDEKLFVSQYLIQLPSPEQLKAFIENELKNL